MEAGTVNPIEGFTLIGGVGDYSKGTACVVSAAVAEWRWKRGEPLDGATDALECIDPCVRRLAIRINDAGWWESDEERTEALMPFVSRLAGTLNKDLLVQRAMLCADVAIRQILPMRLEDTGRRELAEQFRARPEITTREHALKARNAAASYAAAAAADAAADAYAAARRASGKAAAREECVRYRNIAIQLLDRLIRI